MSQRWVMPLSSRSTRLVHDSVSGMRDLLGRCASVCKVTVKEIPRCDVLLDKKRHLQFVWGQSHVATYSFISSAST